MAGDLAILSDKHPFLYFYKCADLAAIIDTASVSVYKIEDAYVLANLLRYSGFACHY